MDKVIRLINQSFLKANFLSWVWTKMVNPKLEHVKRQRFLFVFNELRYHEFGMWIT